MIPSYWMRMCVNFPSLPQLPVPYFKGQQLKSTPLKYTDGFRIRRRNMFFTLHLHLNKNRGTICTGTHRKREGLSGGVGLDHFCCTLSTTFPPVYHQSHIFQCFLSLVTFFLWFCLFFVCFFKFTYCGIRFWTTTLLSPQLDWNSYHKLCCLSDSRQEIIDE